MCNFPTGFSSLRQNKRDQAQFYCLFYCALNPWITYKTICFSESSFIHPSFCHQPTVAVSFFFLHHSKRSSHNHYQPIMSKYPNFRCILLGLCQLTLQEFLRPSSRFPGSETGQAWVELPIHPLLDLFFWVDPSY